MAYIVDVDAGDSIDIDNGRIKVQMLEKSGRRARLSIDADRSVNIRKLARQGSETLSRKLKER